MPSLGIIRCTIVMPELVVSSCDPVPRFNTQYCGEVDIVGRYTALTTVKQSFSATMNDTHVYLMRTLRKR